MNEENTEFWWSEWGAKNALKAEIVVVYPFILLGVGFLLASHFDISPTSRYILIVLGVFVVLASMFATVKDYRRIQKWVENND